MPGKTREAENEMFELAQMGEWTVLAECFQCAWVGREDEVLVEPPATYLCPQPKCAGKCHPMNNEEASEWRAWYLRWYRFDELMIELETCDYFTEALDEMNDAGFEHLAALQAEIAGKRGVMETELVEDYQDMLIEFLNEPPQQPTRARSSKRKH